MRKRLDEFENPFQIIGSISNIAAIAKICPKCPPIKCTPCCGIPAQPEPIEAESIATLPEPSTDIVSRPRCFCPLAAFRCPMCACAIETAKK